MEYITRIFTGRITQRVYGLGFLFYMAIILLMGLLTSLALATPLAKGNSLSGFSLLLTLCVYVVILIHVFSLHVRRLHDIGWSGMWSLITLIGPFGLFLFVALLIMDGQPTANVYGAVPPKEKDFFMALFNRPDTTVPTV